MVRSIGSNASSRVKLHRQKRSIFKGWDIEIIEGDIYAYRKKPKSGSLNTIEMWEQSYTGSGWRVQAWKGMTGKLDIDTKHPNRVSAYRHFIQLIARG